MAKRTALSKSKKGGFKETSCELMLAPLFEHLIKETKMDPKIVEDITIGNVLQPGAGVA
jgi:acetyl-CoA acyltransferase 1